MNAALLPLAALTLTAGGFGDRFGRRSVFILGVALFGVGSVLSAMPASWAVAALELAEKRQGGRAMLPPRLLASRDVIGANLFTATLCIDADATYSPDIFPAVLLLAFGMGSVVAPSPISDGSSA